MGVSQERFFASLRSDPRAQSVLLAQAAEIAGLGFFVVDMEQERLEFCSESHARIFRRTAAQFESEATGLGGNMPMIHPDDVAEVRAAYQRLRTGQPIRLAYRFFLPDGSTGYIREFVGPQRDEEGRVVRGVGASVDVTEMHREQEAVSHKEKLLAIGELTAGVAHDFNNILAIIMGHAELMLRKTPDGEVSLEEIFKAAKKGGHLTRTLLSVAQRAPVSPVDVELCSETRRIVEAYSASMPGMPEIGLAACLACPVCRVDRLQLQAAVLNLLVNARHAIAKGGDISVLVDLDRTVWEDLEYGEPTPFGVIAVSDTGIGIPERILDRVTEPFFTTRTRAEGSGLGLSMARGFARQFGGDLLVASKEGEGTTVSIVIPVLSGD